MRLIIAGGRDYRPRSGDIARLDDIYSLRSIDEVVSGRCGYAWCPWDDKIAIDPPKLRALEKERFAWRVFLESIDMDLIVGADIFGEWWAARTDIPIRAMPADWKKHGNGAGPIRNREMAEYAGPQGGCVLLPGGRGTQSMHDEAVRAGLTIFDWRKL
jgi:hypothetical protein